jgi:hypothetical protein
MVARYLLDDDADASGESGPGRLRRETGAPLAIGERPPYDPDAT